MVNYFNKSATTKRSNVIKMINMNYYLWIWEKLWRTLHLIELPFKIMDKSKIADSLKIITTDTLLWVKILFLWRIKCLKAPIMSRQYRS